ncbi:MAG TPA: S8 family serine peptidase [Candidatus Thalassarchaeaceae archaeon]|jgi:uncharacterized membrane protein|nr:S8 family serine peptidase [Candidatus Thalassarchaeaceae archaeon]HJL54605.1 S8 family serine peptidase [Candidatus Thalassarchaeaceae archaeon]HJO84181.1 S8 family serine peptidase [Candidatus Thalassarchaeaceae archaeon]|tara:strand:+ start:1262 stop:5776 length:4515 start_codon:yes stop_codon:yes gene_type:complete
MNKQVSLLILVLLLSSFAPIASPQSDFTTNDETPLEPQLTRIEISPDPDSIRDLGLPVILPGSEAPRPVRADSSIGVYSDSGLFLDTELPERLRVPRPDLIIALIDSKVSLWDARNEISDVADVAIRSTIPPSGFLVQGTEAELGVVSGLPIVTSSHEVPLALLLDSLLWDDTPDALTEVELLGWKDAELNRLDTPGFGLSGSLRDLVTRSLDEPWTPGVGIHFGSLSSSEAAGLAMHPQVSFISPVLTLTTFNNQVRSHMGVNIAETAFVTGLTGSNQTIAVADTGIDHDHGDFDSITVHRVDVSGDGTTADMNDGHGTHVSCTVLGSGFRTSTYEGVAPETDLYLQAMEDDDTGTLAGPGVYTLLGTAYNSGGARLHTNSWGGLDAGGDYTTQSEDADDRTSTWDQYWTYEGMTVLFAAGNERDDGISPPGTAKNVITVGAHVNRYSLTAADEMYYWSSRGPTDDGRIKPDLVAPGDYVRSCRSQEAVDAPNNINNQWYVEYSGTSMATPAAAGASVIVRQYLMEVAERPAPQGALVKAMLILGAEDMGTRDIPNEDEGWGRLNLVNTLVPDGDIGTFVDDRSRLSSGQQAEYNFDVTRAGEPLKVVLAWSDYPGSTWSNTQLRNDLNLEVTSPDGQVTYFGNDFSNGKSTTGGTKDNKNNVEVVLIDSAAMGVWNVKVKDFTHGGSRHYQPYAIAVRGVNVNDLVPDPAIIPSSFEISTPIPQVGEETQFSVSVVNQGSGSFPEVHVSAYVNANHIETKTLGMSPGEDAVLEWDWTPTGDDVGNSSVRIEIDPNDQLEEQSEDNNILVRLVPVSAPGIQASSATPWKTLGDATDETTTWPIVMTNLALFETNATIDVSDPVRSRDGDSFPWFKAFEVTEVNLGPAESTAVNLTLVHPAPPEPGTYAMVVTATDVEYDVESQLEIFFYVPVLAQPDVTLPGESISVDSFETTNVEIEIWNQGNGAQTYDVELASPAGWDLGFDDIGSFPGSAEGSTGTLSKEASIPVEISIEPPGVLIDAGATFEAHIIVKSRVSSETWSFALPLVIEIYDSIQFTPTSGGIQTGIPADSLHEITLQIANQGNRELLLTPIDRALPGGWTISGGLDSVTIPRGSSTEWSFSIKGNGLAAGGPVEVRFLTDDGFSADWNTTLLVISSAVPTISFDEVVFVNGSSVDSSNTPLGLGAHPVGAPGFDMAWKVTNDGTSNWQPNANMELPSEDWTSICSVSPPKISPDQTATVWCTIVIPVYEEAGSEPEVTLVLSEGGIESRHTISLLVETVNEVIWTLQNMNEAHEGYSTTLYFELQNTGNSVVSNRLATEGPTSWDIRILDGILVTLQPGEIRSVQISFIPNSGSDGEVVLMLADAEHVSGHSTSLQIDVIPDDSSDGTLTWVFGLAILLIVTLAGAAALLYQRNGGTLKALLDRTPSVWKQRESHGHDAHALDEGELWDSEPETEAESNPGADSDPETEQSEPKLERFSEYPGWLWDSDKQEWVPDPNHQAE